MKNKYITKSASTYEEQIYHKICIYLWTINLPQSLQLLMKNKSTTTSALAYKEQIYRSLHLFMKNQSTTKSPFIY